MHGNYLTTFYTGYKPEYNMCMCMILEEVATNIPDPVENNEDNNFFHNLQKRFAD